MDRDRRWRHAAGARTGRGLGARAVALGLAAASLWAAPVAQAQQVPPLPPTASDPRAPFHGRSDAGIHIVSYSADPSCPDEAAFVRELERLLGSAAGHGPRLEVAVDVARFTSASGYVISVDVHRTGSRSQRNLHGESCSTLIETAALITAIAHDPTVVAERTAPADRSAAAAPIGESPAAVVSQSPPTVAMDPPRPPDPTLPASFEAHPRAPAPTKRGEGVELAFVQRFGASMSFGDVPGVGAGFAVGMGLEIDAYRVELGLDVVFGSEGEVPGRSDASVDFTRVVGVLRGCRWLLPWAPKRATWRPNRGARGTFGEPRLGLCTGAELGALEGKSSGVSNPASGDALWFAPRLDVLGELRLVGPLSVNLGAGLAIPVDPRRYVLRAGGELEPLVVHEPGPVAGRGAFDLQLRW